METDLVLYATGRAPAVSDIGLENVDVAQRDNGAIVIDEEFRTSESNYCAGRRYRSFAVNTRGDWRGDVFCEYTISRSA